MAQSWSRAMAAKARSGPEFVSFTLAKGPLLAAAPRGDGHPVLVLPGLGGSDVSTAPLRWFLGRLGYRAVGWGLGQNEGFGRHVTDGLNELLAAQARGGPVSLWAGASAVFMPSSWPGGGPMPCGPSSRSAAH
jgi:hypothetical protein